MKLYVDLNSLSLISQPGYTKAVEQIYLRRADTVPFSVYFVQDGVIVDPGTADVFLVIKSAGNYNEASPLVAAGSAFTKSGTGTTTVFTKAVDISSATIDTALSIASGNGTASVDAMGEISWSISGAFLTARRFTVTIESDLNRA